MAKQHAEEEVAALTDRDQWKDSLKEIHAEWVKMFDSLLEKGTWDKFDTTGILLSYPLRSHYDRMYAFYEVLPAEFEQKHGTDHSSWPKLDAYLERLLGWLELIDLVVGDSRDPYSDQAESYCSFGSAHGSRGDEGQSDLETQLSGTSCRGSLHGDCSVRVPSPIGSDEVSAPCPASQNQDDARTCSVIDESYRSPDAVQSWIDNLPQQPDQSVISSQSPE